MRINRSSRTSDIFAEALQKLAKQMPGTDKSQEQRLQEHRDLLSHETKPSTEEKALEPVRKDTDVGQNLIEKNLRESGVDETVELVIEAQLSENDGQYPHRNPDAYERTGDKRPVNALDEEMGDAGDKSKLERYERASKPGPKRILDKDVGKQLTNEKTTVHAFNLKTKNLTVAKKMSGDYLAYRSGSFNPRFVAVRKLDDKMLGILTAANGRLLTDNEKNQIEALKSNKKAMLRMAAGLSGLPREVEDSESNSTGYITDWINPEDGTCIVEWRDGDKAGQKEQTNTGKLIDLEAGGTRAVNPLDPESQLIRSAP